MRKIRVLIVDDSTVIRRLLTETLNEDSDIEVAATAPDGKIALAKLPQVCPDVVTLDVEMPEMSGLETLVELRKTHPKLPVIMFSTLTLRGGEATLDALSRGANDYVTKPANVGSVTSAMSNVRNELIPKIKGLCHWYADKQLAQEIPASPKFVQNKSVVKPETKRNRIDVVAIGVSTGGPNALAAILPSLPQDYPVPILVVQHMPPVFTKLLAERLDATSQLNVVEGQHGQELVPGTVYIAPGDLHMQVVKHGGKAHLELDSNPPENSCRPAVDVLFRSVAKTYGSSSLGVILTGMGQDGLRGCEYLKEVGAAVVSQDQASSVVWGMPGAVARANVTDKILPLEEMAKEIMDRASHNRTQRFAIRT
jgi:two-component system, chemotaxis family, protein-glutamate methylesterase/glutaminase